MFSLCWFFSMLQRWQRVLVPVSSYSMKPMHSGKLYSFDFSVIWFRARRWSDVGHSLFGIPLALLAGFVQSSFNSSLQESYDYILAV